LKSAQLHNFGQILLVGAGEMSREYLRVLHALEVDFTVVCRSKSSAKKFSEQTGHPAISGGLKNFFKDNKNNISAAIVAVGVENLANVSMQLLQNGINKILIEKPAGIFFKEITDLAKLANNHKASVFVAYNRRFFASSQKAKEIIKLDGGATSFNFEFTEWSHVIEPLVKGDSVKERWFLSNSSHVADLAFFLGGKPQEITSYTRGKDNLSWHPTASVFSGSGVTINNVLFSYYADWTGPGRWGVEIVTKKNRLILRPMEELQIQRIGSVNIEHLEISDAIDKSFKPGLFKQVEAFINDDFTDLCTIVDQHESMKIFHKIANYTI